MKLTRILRQMLQQGEFIVAPGVFDGLSALLTQRAGFSVLYASGGAIARSHGYPDIGLLTMTEVCAAIEHIVGVTQMPVIADADTGFGNSINVSRTVKVYERLGVAALHIEDQTFPKRCGHLNDKSIIPTEEMCHKLKVARDSLTDPNFLLIARTDAIPIEGVAGAIIRAQAYIQAGADIIFIEAPESIEQIELIAQQIHHPKLINMFYGGKTPLLPTQRLKELGYQIVIIPSDLQRAAIKAIQTALGAIARDGSSMAIADQLTSFQEREVIVDTEKYLKLDKMGN